MKEHDKVHLSYLMNMETGGCTFNQAQVCAPETRGGDIVSAVGGYI